MDRNVPLKKIKELLYKTILQAKNVAFSAVYDKIWNIFLPKKVKHRKLIIEFNRSSKRGKKRNTIRLTKETSFPIHVLGVDNVDMDANKTCIYFACRVIEYYKVVSML